MIRPQGKICYSTCSIQKEENGRLVGEFLRKNRNFKLESELFDCDGGYIAIIRRDA
jgi:16S rRNA C967 or C1407 C5-methylase (RsmB/RsmF family)